MTMTLRQREGSEMTGPRKTSLLTVAEPRQSGDILAGLPAHVMDELVSDLAEAVLAVLLSAGTSEPGGSDDASGSL
jgi:hypothetical protein